MSPYPSRSCPPGQPLSGASPRSPKSAKSLERRSAALSAPSQYESEQRSEKWKIHRAYLLSIDRVTQVAGLGVECSDSTAKSHWVFRILSNWNSDKPLMVLGIQNRQTRLETKTRSNRGTHQRLPTKKPLETVAFPGVEENVAVPRRGVEPLLPP